MEKNWRIKRLFLSICLVTAIIALTGCNTKQNGLETESTKQSEKKKTSVENKENQNTRESFQNKLEKQELKIKGNPNNKSNNLKYARTQFSLGNFNEAKKIIQPYIQSKDAEALLLAAEISYLNGRYSEAEEYYNTLLKEHKEAYGIQAESGLQMVYYQTKQFNKASELFTDQKDLENPMLDMMKDFGDIKPYEIDWHGRTSTTIPFIKTSIGVYVPIEINGVKMNAFVDTGADGLTIDKEKAGELGIDSVSETEGQFAGGQSNKVGFGRTDKLNIGGVDIENVPTMLGSFEAWENAAGFKEAGNVHAVIGTNILKQFIPTINFLGKELTLDQRSETGRAKLEERQKEEKLEATVPFTLSGTHYIHGKGTINGVQSLNMFVDSGFISESDQGINLPKETMDLANISMPKLEKPDVAGMGGSDFKTGSFDVDSYGLEDLKMSKASGLYETGNTLSNMFDATGFVTDAMIGESYLNHYKWTLDFEEMTMNFRK